MRQIFAFFFQSSLYPNPNPPRVSRSRLDRENFKDTCKCMCPCVWRFKNISSEHMDTSLLSSGEFVLLHRRCTCKSLLSDWIRPVETELHVHLRVLMDILYIRTTGLAVLAVAQLYSSQICNPNTGSPTPSTSLWLDYLINSRPRHRVGHRCNCRDCDCT
jgi:hypothetical protein